MLFACNVYSQYNVDFSLEDGGTHSTPRAGGQSNKISAKSMHMHDVGEMISELMFIQNKRYPDIGL